jgi:hypothetical protein
VLATRGEEVGRTSLNRGDIVVARVELVVHEGGERQVAENRP